MAVDNVLQVLLLASIVSATCLLLLNKLTPSPKPSRLRAEYGLRLEYPIPRDSEKTEISAEDGLTTDVVFVHGLGADPTLTWRQGDVCWISDLLPKDLKEKGLQSCVRLLTFNYDSFWVRDANSTRLTVTARSLGQRLNDALHDHDIVLVGHSYGGLVIKQALVELPELKSRVKGVLFLGTPHLGTPFSRYGMLAATLLAPLDADTDIIRPLATNSISLKELDEKFQERFKTTRRLYYFETHKTRRYLLGFIPWMREFVVPENSATAGADYSQIIALPTDHRGLNKFHERKGNYLLVVEKLLDILLADSPAQSKYLLRLERQPEPLRNGSPSWSSQETHWADPFEKGGHSLNDGSRRHYQIMALQQQQQLVYQHNLPPQILYQKPVILNDARGRTFPFFPDFIGSTEILVQILMDKFKDFGSGKIKKGEWFLQDHHTGRVLDLRRPWGSLFRPGQVIDMSMVFRRRKMPSSYCPRCQSENYGTPETQVTCYVCDLTYRRIEEVHEIGILDDVPTKPQTTRDKDLGQEPKLTELFPNPRPPNPQDDEEDMTPYTRIQVIDIEFLLQAIQGPEQAGIITALALQKLESIESAAAYLAKMWSLSEEDCLFLLEELEPRLATIKRELEKRHKRDSSKVDGDNYDYNAEESRRTHDEDIVDEVVTSPGSSEVTDVETVRRHLVTRSQFDETIREEVQNSVPPNNSEEFSSFSLQGGDTTRPIYKWVETEQTKTIKRTKSFDLHDPQATSEIHSIKAPGGYRRSFLERAKRSTNQPATQSFVEFLTMYGHFAGEDLEDDDEVLPSNEYYSSGVFEE